jgi:hypothetical protein
MVCYYCRSLVEGSPHREHIAILTAFLNTSVDGLDRAFRHMRRPGRSRSGREKRLPPDECFDVEGTAVVCDRCFIREIAEAIG